MGAEVPEVVAFEAIRRLYCGCCPRANYNIVSCVIQGGKEKESNIYAKKQKNYSQVKIVFF